MPPRLRFCSGVRLSSVQISVVGAYPSPDGISPPAGKWNDGGSTPTTGAGSPLIEIVWPTMSGDPP